MSACGQSWGKFWDTSRGETVAAPAQQKAITSYSIPSQGITGIITGTNITLLSPTLTSLSPMVAAFVTTGKSVAISGLAQTSGVTANSYTSTLVYTVTAENGSTQNYNVLLTAPKMIGGAGALKHWYRADALGFADNTQISSWTDESGNNNHATQGTAALRPIYRTNRINGYPTAKFTSAPATTASVPGNGLTADKDGSFFIVFSYGTATAFSLFNLCGVNGRQFDLNGTIGQFIEGRNGVGYNYTSAFAIPLNAFIAVGSVHTGTASVTEVWNGDFKGLQVPTLNFITAGTGYLSNGGLDGEIAELLYFDVPLTQAEQNKVFCYLNTKYALTGATAVCAI